MSRNLENICFWKLIVNIINMKIVFSNSFYNTQLIGIFVYCSLSCNFLISAAIE